MNFQAIYQIRLELCLTQAELGKLMGTSTRTIQRWEADEVYLDIDAVKREAALQGCPVLGDEDYDFKPIRAKQ